MRGRISQPVTVNGTTFPSVKAAAECYGVKPVTMYKHLKNGTLPYTAMIEQEVHKEKRERLEKRKLMEKKDSGNRNKVLVDGRLFPSMGDAALHLGVSVRWLSKNIANKKPCRGHEVRYAEEIDVVLAEIEERNRQPYQFS